MRHSKFYTLILFLVFGLLSQNSFSQSCVATDTEAPIIICPENVVGLTCSDVLPLGAFNEIDFNAIDTTSNVSDNCAIQSIDYIDTPDPATFSFCAADGPFVVTRTYTVIDSAGLQANCSYTFTFDADTEAPVVINPGNIMAVQNLECLDDTNPSALDDRFGEGFPDITDNCTGSATSGDIANSPTAMVGFEPDSPFVVNGFTIYYSDTIIVHPGGACSGTNQRKYRIIRTWTAIDACGNIGTVDQNINVVDNFVAPIPGVNPLDLVYSVGADCSVVVNASEIEEGSTDNCGPESDDPSTYDVSASAEIRIAGSMDTFANSITIDTNIIDFAVASPFPVTIELQVTDECGNTAVINKEILIQDTIVPEITCPANMVIDLAMLQCDSTIIFDDPIATDNCPDVVVNRTDTNGYNSGDAFPIGTYEFTYEAVDLAGNTASCSFTIEVVEAANSSLACLSAINVSIDESCSGNITPRMVLLGDDYGCLENFDIIVYNEAGQQVPNMFTGADIGKSFTYEVVNGPLLCDGVVHIEDKFPPQIACISDTISCGELIVFPNPQVIDNCSGATLTLLNETFAQVACDDSVLQQVITREWQAVDAAGNVSPTCVQTLSISKFDIGTVQPPANQQINLECGIPFPTDASGAPNPIVYGSPRLNGVNLWPSQFLVCNLMVTYEDQTLQTSMNTTSIVRTWSATTWYCGVDSTRQFVQVFNIADTQGPILDCPGDMSFSTSGLNCEAVVELPAIGMSDLCGEVVDIDVQYEGGFLNNSNGGLAALPNGISTVTYTATDNSGNISSCNFQVTVTDNEQPTPVCQQFTIVTLTNDGTAIVDASSFDDGSYDACGPVTLSVRRMNPSCDPTDIVFGESISFCCQDLGVDQQVVLRVTDQGGLFNECMVIANVQDKIPPVLVQGLPDITLSCEFPFNTEDTEQFGSIVMDPADREDILLTADLVQFNGEAKDGLVLGNCVELVADEFTFSNINGCGLGSATRILTFQNAQGLFVTDVQIITFVNPSPFTASDITFPNNINFTNICDVSLTNPENLPTGFNYPTYVEDGCDQIGLDYEDQFIDQSNGAMSCYKIIRTWTVADWCQNNNGIFAMYEGQQTIEVTNTIDPVIDGDCSNREVCSYDIGCGPMYIELLNSGTDDCTDSTFLLWNYAIDYFTDGNIDAAGTTNDASGTYPVGLHTIYWTLNDQCGNEDVCSYTFEIKNCKAATPICLDNLTAEINPMDTDGDNLPDTEQLMIDASFFDGGSYHVCGTPIQLSFSSNVNDVTRIFGCNDIGLQPIELWVTDINGNQDFCTTTLDVQNNIDEGFCLDGMLMDISGIVKTDEDEMISDATVVLIGGEAIDLTEEDGYYSFADMPTGGNYVVNPSKDIDPLNGVTTLDIILIQKHILGLEPLNTPYKLIAADVNHSDHVSGQDIIQLRKLILGHYETFPSNSSWRFVDASYEFIDATNPWISTFPETYEINNLQTNMIVDFKGVKIGDVNGSAAPNQLVGDDINTRSSETLDLRVEDGNISAGSTSWIPVYADNFVNMAGFQLGLRPKNVEILDVRSTTIDLTESNFQINRDGTLRVLWHDAKGKTLSSEEVLFEILVDTKEGVQTTAIFDISDEIFHNESYTNNLEVNGITLDVRTTVQNTETSQIGLQMEQNEPNPWMDRTSINIVSTATGQASFRVMNMNGQVLLSRSVAIAKGENTISISKDEISTSGVLYYELELNGTKMMKKMVLIK